MVLSQSDIPSSRFSATTTDCPACVNYKKAVITDPDSGEIVCSGCKKTTITNQNGVFSVSKK